MLVRHARLSAVERERDEWQRRAESAVRPATRYVVVRRSAWTRLVSAVWLLALGLLVGGVALPRANDAPTLQTDFPACIGKARYENPIQDNQYQELVNALYTCDVYRAG